jgi:hypothetical protein
MKMQCDHSILSVLESLALSNNFQALAVVERLQAHTCQALDEGKNPMHSVRDPF